VLAPDFTTRLAHSVGIGRGTDLLLYALVMTFVFTTAGLYFRCRDIERRLVEVSRAVALRDALAAGGPPANRPPPADPVPVDAHPRRPPTRPAAAATDPNSHRS
jgi:hypothetical protein